jgi:hypothetical protein
MNVYDIEDGFRYSDTHCVVAESMAKAEEIWKEKYKATPLSIKLHSQFVHVQEPSFLVNGVFIGNSGELITLLQEARKKKECI